MTPPDLNFAIVGPIAWVGIGAMVVLVGEVFLTRARTFLGRPVTESYIGSVLAFLSMFFLGVAVYMSVVHAMSGAAVAFNPDNPMFQLDSYSAFLTALVALTHAQRTQGTNTK